MSGWNGFGVFTRVYSWVADANAGIDITASRMDTDTDNITANGFGNCLTRDGQGSASANLPMNGYVHTGVGDATLPAEYASLNQLINGSASFTNLNVNNGSLVGCINGFVPVNSSQAVYYSNSPGPNDHTWQHFVGQLTSSGYAAVIYGNGDMINQNNSYGAISDSKLKQDIVPATSQWDDIKAIARITSKFHLKTNPDGPLQIGVIAQALQKISPGLVASTADYEYVQEPKLDADGKAVIAADGKTPETSTVRKMLGTETLHVNYSVLYMKAVKALGESLERIEALEQKVK